MKAFIQRTVLNTLSIRDYNLLCYTRRIQIHEEDLNFPSWPPCYIVHSSGI